MYDCMYVFQCKEGYDTMYVLNGLSSSSEWVDSDYKLTITPLLDAYFRDD